MKFHLKSLLLGSLVVVALFITSLEARNNEEVVILLHGIARTHHSMHKMEENLINAGYTVINVHYPSRKYTLEELTQWLKKDLEKENINQYHKVNFVTHSMGGLLARAYCKKFLPKNMGRLVMLGPPNHGSELADLLHNNFLFKLIYGPAGQQLTTFYDLGSIVGEPNYEIGIIAGTKSLIPCSQLIFEKSNDGMVSVNSTKLKLAKAHIVLSVNHALIMQNDIVIRKTKRFLKYGEF